MENKNKLKVVLLGNYPTYNFSKELGLSKEKVKRITTWNENLAESLSKINDLDVTFITSTKSISETKTVHKGNLSVVYFVAPTKANMFTFFYYTIFKVTRIINNIKPDIVHGIGTEHIWPTIATRYRGSNVITIHGILNEFDRDERLSIFSVRRYFAFRERRILRSTQNIISINPYVEEICNRLNPIHNYYSIPNPVSGLFSSFEASPETSKQIIFIGDFERRKNVGMFLEAMSQVDKRLMSGITLKIIGAIKDAEYYNTVMEKTPAEIKDLIDNIPFMFPEGIAEEMSRSAMLVLTSLNETAPMVIAEAMTIGLPVLATDVGGVKHMLANEDTGFVVRPSSVLDLAAKIEMCLTTPSIRADIGAKAKIVAREHYDQDKVAEKTAEVYKKIVKLSTIRQL